MKTKLYSLIALFLVASFSANAALIKIESADINSNFNQIDLQAYWNTITPDNSQNVTDLSGYFFNGSGNNNTIYKLTANFSSVNTMDVEFFAGLDAGHGAEIFVNNVLKVDIDSDIWWKRDWNNANVINVQAMFGAGNNTIELYWAEGKNSGGNGFRLVENVSAPSALAITLLGLGGLLVRRRIKAS